LDLNGPVACIKKPSGGNKAGLDFFFAIGSLGCGEPAGFEGAVHSGIGKLKAGF
jgi:hypothetical protein